MKSYAIVFGLFTLVSTPVFAVPTSKEALRFALQPIQVQAIYATMAVNLFDLKRDPSFNCFAIGAFASTLSSYGSNLVDSKNQIPSKAAAIGARFVDVWDSLSGFCGGSKSLKQGDKTAVLSVIEEARDGLGQLETLLK